MKNNYRVFYLSILLFYLFAFMQCVKTSKFIHDFMSRSVIIPTFFEKLCIEAWLYMGFAFSLPIIILGIFALYSWVKKPEKYFRVVLLSFILLTFIMLKVYSSFIVRVDFETQLKPQKDPYSIFEYIP